jgi:hypothetical protein
VHGCGGQQPEHPAGREGRLGDLDANGHADPDLDADRPPIRHTDPNPHSNRCPDGHPDAAAVADRGACSCGSSPDAGRLLSPEQFGHLL